ncbi:MAG: EamA family transporter [Chloroflexi bacterium]|nr:EamA family transporter [Chloroflexota bacterium]
MSTVPTEGKREKPMVTTLIIAVIAILLLVGGQTCLKLGLNAVGGLSFLHGAVGANLGKMFSTPYIILGFAFYGLSAILWLDVLSKLDFSFAFPLVSLTYVFSLIIGRLLFHETVTWTRVGGVGLIIMGLFLIIRSGR